MNTCKHANKFLLKNTLRFESTRDSKTNHNSHRLSNAAITSQVKCIQPVRRAGKHFANVTQFGCVWLDENWCTSLSKPIVTRCSADQSFGKGLSKLNWKPLLTCIHFSYCFIVSEWPWMYSLQERKSSAELKSSDKQLNKSFAKKTKPLNPSTDQKNQDLKGHCHELRMLEFVCSRAHGKF